MLNTEESRKYSRHILLSQIGVSGQEKIKASRILIVGVGGLGCSLAQLLTASGVGEIALIDGDKVDLSNLQRQILFTQNDIGILKVDVAKAKLQALNPETTITNYSFFLTSENIKGLFINYDVVVDCTDDIATKILTNNEAIMQNKPLVYGALHKFEGQVSTFNYKGGPTYSDLFTDLNKMQAIPQCSEVGVYSILPNIIANFQANEVLKIVLDIGNVLSGKLLTYNALTNNIYTISYDKI